MSSQFKTKEFLELKAKWYNKLRKSGFDDKERDENNMKQWDAHAFNSRYDKNQFGAKETYYRWAGQFLHEKEFRNKRDRIIWELHAQGATVREIEKELKSRQFKIHTRSGVQWTINKLRKEMLDKYGKEDY